MAIFNSYVKLLEGTYLLPSGYDIHSLPWKDPPFLSSVNPFIVDFPIKNGGSFHNFLYVYQRVNHLFR